MTDIMSGQDLTKEQAVALETLRENMKNILRPEHGDLFLLRWLRAKKFDTKKTEEMLRKSLDWREKNGVDSVLQDYTIPDILRTHFTGGMCGFDKEGCPVWVDPFGRMDFKGVMRSAKKADIIKAKIYHIEKFSKVMEEQSKKLGKVIDKEVIIYDLEHFGMKHLWRPGVDLFNEMVRMLEDNYPGRLKCVFVINAPKIFPVIWRLTKPFLAAETSRKVNVYGTSNYQAKLLQHIDADQLPAAYGGTLTDCNGDVRCSAMIVQGGEVPRERYGDFHSVDKDKMASAKVDKGSTLDLEYDVTQAGSVLRWQFLVDKQDVEFRVCRQAEADLKEVIKPCLVSCQLFPEDGSVICTVPGTYVARFGNTSGSNVKVDYVIDVLEPDDRSFDGINDVSPTKA